MSVPVVRLEFLGQDGDTLRRFYSDVLGWPVEPEDGSFGPPQGTGAARSRRTTGTHQEAGVIAARGSTPVPLEEALAGGRTSVFYARVPDLSVALQRALSYGSEVLVPPTLLRHTVVAVVSDPSGNPVGLCT